MANIKKKDKDKDDVDTKIVLDAIIESMLNIKAENIVSMDLTNLQQSICNYFIIADANSPTHVASIASHIEDDVFLASKRKVLRKQGYENSIWIILDYGDIVIHIFQTEYREFYKLEQLWADAKITYISED